MFRCVFAAALVAAGLLPCQAQDTLPARKFPAHALRGSLVVTQPPEVTINGQPARLSPGARIRSPDNMLVLSGALVGQPLLVHYTLDTLGQAQLVWVLRPEEAARQPWPTTAQEAERWLFDADSQTWTRR